MRHTETILVVATKVRGYLAPREGVQKGGKYRHGPVDAIAAHFSVSNTMVPAPR